MTQSKKKQAELREEKGWEGLEHAVIESEHFVAKYQKQILIAVGVFVVIACAYIGYHYFIVTPKTHEAEVAMFKGEKYFGMGQDSIALVGNGNDYIGFEAIANTYGSTKPGKLAKYYTGLCYSNMKQYDKALEYLKDFSADDFIVAHLVNGAIGDCLDNTGKPDEAVTYYLKAAKGVDNIVHSPIYYKKAGIIYRSQGKNDDALKMFKTIKEQYPKSPVAGEVEKYIEEAELKGSAK